jgi:hypothetical protein
LARFFTGLLVGLLLIAAAAAYVWYQRPDLLPEGKRAKNPQSTDYAPAIYRWKDERGRTQISDTPPKGRAYETVRIDPNTNVVPDTLPRERDVRQD